jgi:serine phosphatase RsbU (regulator of sigma subunit)
MVVALNQKDNGLQDGMDMAICIIDSAQKKLKFAGAKNPLIYTKDGELNYIKGDLLPIGGMIENARNYRQHELDYDASMNFYLMTDGYVDQFGGTKNKKFNRKTLMNLIHEHQLKPMKEQGAIYEKVLLEWQQSETQNDDITLFGFNITS